MHFTRHNGDPSSGGNTAARTKSIRIQSLMPASFASELAAEQARLSNERRVIEEDRPSDGNHFARSSIDMVGSIEWQTSSLPDGLRSSTFIQRATCDLKALDIPAQDCREAYLTSIAMWASTPEREKAAIQLPVELFEADIEGLSDDEAEIAEREHAERFRNIYRYSFGDKAPSHRTYVRSEVREEWLLFVSIFALVHPEKAKAWFDPERELQMSWGTTERTLRAHGRKSWSGQASNSHSRHPTNALQDVTLPKSAMED